VECILCKGVTLFLNGMSVVLVEGLAFVCMILFEVVIDLQKYKGLGIIYFVFVMVELWSLNLC